jgi:TetR/AcrR family transcriptional repressor of nem operon
VSTGDSIEKRGEQVVTNNREAILEAAKKAAQAHGYSGLNFRDLAQEVGIKSASLYYHFASKAELGAAVARRYWEDSAAELDALLETAADPMACLRQYPNTFRRSLESDNRMCLCSYMAAEYDDLPDAVKTEVQAFADVNVAWLAKVLTAAASAAGAAGQASAEQNVDRARAIYAAVVGAQLVARSRADITLYDRLIDSYRAAGLLPA